jgi:hypothetical protein
MSNDFHPQLAIELTTEENDDYPDALTDIRISLTTSQPNSDGEVEEVGSLTALKIERVRCRGNFFLIMDSDGELADVYDVLFDENEKINPSHLNDEYHKGLGIWGDELNSGDIIIEVESNVCFLPSSMVPQSTHPSQSRSIGLGSQILNHLMSSDLLNRDDFIITWPAPSRSTNHAAFYEDLEEGVHVNKAIYDGIQADQVGFFRKVGFASFSFLKTSKLKGKFRTAFVGLEERNISHILSAVPCIAFNISRGRFGHFR